MRGAETGRVRKAQGGFLLFRNTKLTKLWIENTHNRTIQQGPLWMLVNETIFTPSLERFEIEIIVITVNIIAIIIIMIKSTLF